MISAGSTRPRPRYPIRQWRKNLSWIFRNRGLKRRITCKYGERYVCHPVNLRGRGPPVKDRVHSLGGILKRIENFRPERFEQSFDERLKLQKTIYLLQQGFGIHLGYRPNWYLRGPYSPNLARDGFALTERYKDIPEQWFSDRKLEARFQRFLDFIKPHGTDAEWLETAASILYLVKEMSYVPERAANSVALRKRRISKSYALKVLNELKSSRLLV